MHFDQKTFISAGVMSAMFLGTPVFADVGARDVWESWRDYLAGMGNEITATEQEDGNTLTVRDLIMNVAMPEEEGSVSISFGEMQFVENGDGTVDVVMPNEMPMRILANAEGEDVDAEVMIGHTGMSMVVSGTPEEMTYTYNATQMTAALAKLVVDGEALPDFDVSMVMDGILGRSRMAMGDVITTEQKMSVDSLSYLVKGEDPAGSGSIDLKGSVTGLEGDATGVIPQGDYGDDPTAMFEAGFDINGTYTMQGSDFSLNFIEQGAPGAVSASSGAGSMALEMNGSVMAYNGSVTDVQMNAMGPDIPLPIDVSMGEFGYGIQLPLASGDAPQDLAMNLKLVDLGVSELIWGMFDPGQVLPHDPATLVVDLVGKATVFTNLMTLDENTTEVPGELNALTLKNLQLDVAGATVSGVGDFTFDNTDMVSFDGFPRPEGALDVKILGVNGLMDKLVQMGLLPEEQAMGARMMMSMFSVPGAGPDELNSKIEVNEQGHVLANGQRLK